MMAMFVHDHRFYVEDGVVYSDKLPYSTWQRYLAAFDCVSVVARCDFSDDNRMYVRSSGERVEFNFVGGVSSLKLLLRPNREAVRAIRDLMRNVDLVIVRLPSELGLLAEKLAGRLGKPCLVEVVGCVWDAAWNYGMLKGKLYAPFALWRMKRAATRARYVSYVSQKFLQNRYPARKSAETLFASNVELPRPRDDVLFARLRRMDAGGARRKVIGLIGAFRTRYKGVHVAIEALAQIAADMDVELRVLGAGDAGPYLARAKELGVADRVFFDGVLPAGQAVFNWLDSVDVYIQPSFQEGVPRALIEAMGRGCPALGSNAGGIPELLERENIFRAGDSRALARRLSAVLANASWLRVQASRNFAESKKYCIDVLAARRNEFLEFVRRDVAGGEHVDGAENAG